MKTIDSLLTHTISTIRARHDAVEQRRAWACTVAHDDGEQAHRDRGALLEVLAAIAHAVGICHEPDGGSCVPGPFERVLEEVRLLVRHAGERFDLERERDEARSRVTDLEILAEELMGERDEALAKLDTVGNVLGTVIVAGTLRPGETMRLEGDHAAIDAVRGLLARLARYEAPGPVLLTQEQIDAVANSDWEGSHLSLVHALLAAQHARDVAIVEAMNDESIAIAILTTINRESAGEAVRAAILRALKGEP